MKFILALTMTALAVAGCGQKNQDRPSPKVNSVSSETKDDLAAAAAAIPGNDSSSQDLIAKMEVSNDGRVDLSTPANLGAASARVAALQKSVAVAQAAYDKAIKERSNTVHFSADAFDTFVYGVAGYGLIVDANRRRVLADEESSAITKTARASEVAAEDAVSASKVSEATTKMTKFMKTNLGPSSGVFRTVEFGIGAVAAAYTAGKAIRLYNNDIAVYIDSPETIKATKRNLDLAQDELTVARRDLDAAAKQVVASSN